MSVDNEVAGLLDRCDTLDELREQIRAIFRNHQMEESDRMVNTMIKGLTGGTIARLDENGHYLNPWRRKFFASEATQPAHRHAA